MSLTEKSKTNRRRKTLFREACK